VTPQDLLDKLYRSGLEHDSNSGQCNNGHVHNLEIAVQLLARKGLLDEYQDLLRVQYEDIPEYEWLIPEHGYIDVEDSNETRFVFELLKARGYDRAAATVQNTGRVPLADFHAALDEIEATGEKGQHPANVYRNYINEHAVLGKEL
jgi:hypothetical protein